jgi:hypothetical protein
MDHAIDIAKIEAQLRTGDPGVQHDALVEISGATEGLLETAVQGFRYTSIPNIYAEHLAKFGSAIVPHVENLYRSYEHGRERTSLAILLLYFGDKSGLSDVMSALQIDNESQLLAAHKLASAGIVEAKEPITLLLREYLFGQPLTQASGPKIDSLLLALTNLGAEVPEDMTDRLSAPDCPKYIAAHLPQRGI